MQLYDRETACDLLVVGSEGAGGPAAIAARQAGVDVLMATKGKISQCGASQCAGADFNLDGRSAIELGLPGDDRDSPDRFFADLVREGQFLGNQKMVEKYVEYAALNTRDLLDWGMPFYRFEQVHGEEMARGMIGSGVKWVRAIRRRVRDMRIPILQDTMVVDLLKRDERVIGAVALDLKTGEIVLIRAKAVILATGGWQQAYHFSSAPIDLTGDGQAMAFRAGAQMIAMEMVQYVPMTMLWPPFARKSILPYILAQLPEAGPLIQLLNASGDRFMQQYDSAMMEQSTKEIVAIATELEVEAGRGSEHGGVFFALKHLTPAGIDFLWTKFEEFLDENKDMRPEFRVLLPRLFEQAKTADLEVGNAAHFMCGGIKVNELAETGIPGLYAAGECSGGLWGASRVAAAVTQVGAQGRVAGESASRYLKEVEHVEPEQAQLEEIYATVKRPFSDGAGTGPLVLQQRLHEVTREHLHVIKDGQHLKSACDGIKALRCEAETARVTGSRSPVYNYEWELALELRNMLLCMEMVAGASLAREESRGEFYRRDFPDTDNDGWCRNSVFSNHDGKPDLAFEEPVVTSMQPPTGRMTFAEAVGAATASLKRGEG